MMYKYEYIVSYFLWNRANLRKYLKWSANLFVPWTNTITRVPRRWQVKMKLNCDDISTTQGNKAIITVLRVFLLHISIPRRRLRTQFFSRVNTYNFQYYFRWRLLLCKKFSQQSIFYIHIKIFLKHSFYFCFTSCQF